MEHKTENEFSIEPWLSKIIAHSHHGKFGLNFIKSFFDDMTLGGNFGDISVDDVIFGSMVEGSTSVRNLNPKFKKGTYEMEMDVMVPRAKILKDKSREVIVDLAYAKGFAWIRYKPECFGLKSVEKLDKFLIKYVDGEIYLNSKAIKSTPNGMKSFPSFPCTVKQTIEGPSENLEMQFADVSKLFSKSNFVKASEALHKCVQYVQRANERLRGFYENISSKLEILENAIGERQGLIDIADIEELASVLLPRNKNGKNILLQVYWQLLAFLYECLFVIRNIKRMIHFEHDKLHLLCKPVFIPVAIGNPIKKILECLDISLKDLLVQFPGKVRQKYRKLPSEGLSYFIRKCKQNEVGSIFGTLNNLKDDLTLTHDEFLVWYNCFPTDNLEDKLSNFRGFLSFDRIPTIVVEDWTCVANEWLKRSRAWPSMSLVKKIVMKGCHIVPKPYYGREKNEFLDWRWSFSLPEKILAQNRTKEMDVSYFVLKSIFYRYLKPVEHDGKSIFSYLIKTIMLWQCEENDEKWWSNADIISCIFILLDRLRISFFNMCLPHYFICDINLFNNVAEELILYGQAILESICAEPTICIKEVLEGLFGKEPENDTGNKWNEPLASSDFELRNVDMSQMKPRIKEIIKVMKDNNQCYFMTLAKKFWKESGLDQEEARPKRLASMLNLLAEAFEDPDSVSREKVDDIPLD